MKKAILSTLCAVTVLTFTACTKKLADRLPGTWTVSEVKAEPASANGSSSTSSNVGTMTFEGGGTGSYSLTFFGNPVNGDFTWVASDNNANVTLSGFNIVAGAYTVITNKNNKQVWQRLDSNGDKYTYTLER